MVKQSVENKKCVNICKQIVVNNVLRKLLFLYTEQLLMFDMFTFKTLNLLICIILNAMP